MKNNEPTERKDWCKLPYAVILDERLTAADAVVYAVLLDVSNSLVVTKTMAGIAQLTGISPRQIERIINHLHEAGYIVSKKNDGRKIIIELKPVIAQKKTNSNQKPSEQKPPEQEPNANDNPGGIEATLISALAKKLEGKTPQYINDVYNDLKMQAAARVNDKNKTLAYLSKMISTYEDNSDGFDPYEYEFCINNFD